MLIDDLYTFTGSRKYGQFILRRTLYLDIRSFFQSHRMLGFFFDELMPGSQVRIVPKDDPDTS